MWIVVVVVDSTSEIDGLHNRPDVQTFTLTTSTAAQKFIVKITELLKVLCFFKINYVLAKFTHTVLNN